MWANIPAELKERRQWIVWRLEYRLPMPKPTKVPYEPRPGGRKAAVDNPATWGTFEEAISAPLNSFNPVDPDTPVTGFTGIGFMLTPDDPYSVIDLDATEIAEMQAIQARIYNTFQSYSELSPSGKGCHIWLKGSIPHGKRRGAVEVYSSLRYMTVTGKPTVGREGWPINDCQQYLDILFNELGGSTTVSKVENRPQTEDDETIIKRASDASNGAKFVQLYDGDWHSLYQSQSEADYALIDILAFYTQNREQIARLFRASGLGQRDKARRDDYVNNMIDKAFDRALPEVDLTAIHDKLKLALANRAGEASDQPQPAPASGSSPVTAHTGAPSADAQTLYGESADPVNNPPPGLLGDVARFIYAQSSRPVPQIAIAGAIAYLSGIAGRAYNVTGQGLNQYVQLLAPTGRGKEAMASGISKLNTACQTGIPYVDKYVGPSRIASAPALIRTLSEKPCCLSIVGEFGKMFALMADPRNSHLYGLNGVLNDLWGKSGAGNVIGSSAYSDKEKNVALVASPAFSLLGESVANIVYDSIDEENVRDGTLSRFLILEYNGERQYFNENAVNVVPPLDLVQRLKDLFAQCESMSAQGRVHNIKFTPDAWQWSGQLDRTLTDKINGAQEDAAIELLNRVHAKVLRLAGLIAVGINMYDPVITMSELLWAYNLIMPTTERLIKRFQSGEVGASGAGEAKQAYELKRIFTLWLTKPYKLFEKSIKCRSGKEMHRLGVIPLEYLTKRTNNLTCFKSDRLGANGALKRTLQIMLDTGEIAEVKDALSRFGVNSKAYVVTDPEEFLK